MNKDFLQSKEWRKFQESVGHRTFNVSGDNFRANIIEHKLPVVGGYFYVPRGPIISSKHQASSIKRGFENIINLTKENNVGWVRIEPDKQGILELIQGLVQGFGLEIKKAPHDMQPRQVFIIDISKSEEELLAGMKPKARYNIRLAKKKGVSVRVISDAYKCHSALDAESRHEMKESIDSRRSLSRTLMRDGNDKKRGNNKEGCVDEFLRLVKVTSERNNIKSHPEDYYRKMLEIIPEKNLKLYTAEYRGKIIAANLVSFYDNTATYLHGASDNEYRNVMAPFLLQWQTMLDAKKKECGWYDMGGIKNQKSKIKNQNDNAKCKKLKKSQATRLSGRQASYPPTGQAGKLPAYRTGRQATKWAGITRFKMGFSPETKPVEFPGSYDIVINPCKYWIYRMLQKIRSVL